MDASVSEVQLAGASSSRVLCWVEALILGLGVPSGIWAVSRLISLYIPATVHGSPEQRFLLWILGGGIVEWSFVIMLWFLLRVRRSSFKDLGVWRLGTWPAWILALLIAALSIASNLRFLPRMHIPIYGNNLLDSTTVFCYSLDSEERYEPRTKEPSGCHHILLESRKLRSAPCGATLAGWNREMSDLRK